MAHLSLRGLSFACRGYNHFYWRATYSFQGRVCNFFLEIALSCGVGKTFVVSSLMVLELYPLFQWTIWRVTGCCRVTVAHYYGQYISCIYIHTFQLWALEEGVSACSIDIKKDGTLLRAFSPLCTSCQSYKVCLILCICDTVCLMWMMMTALVWWLEYTVMTEIDVLWWRDDCFLEVSWQSKIKVLTVIDKDSPSLC